MESKKEIDEEIVELTTKIIDQYPELTKYIDELPISIPNTGQLSVSDLASYRNTLKTMINSYEENTKKTQSD